MFTDNNNFSLSPFLCWEKFMSQEEISKVKLYRNYYYEKRYCILLHLIA